MQWNCHFLPLNIKKIVSKLWQITRTIFTLYISKAVPSTVSFQALRADAEMKAGVLKRSVRNRGATNSKCSKTPILESKTFIKMFVHLRNWRRANEWASQKQWGDKNMRENLGAGHHFMTEAISSNIHASMNASHLQTPFKSKSWLETGDRNIPCAKNYLILHFFHMDLAIWNFSWGVNRQTNPNLYYYNRLECQ